MIFVLGFRSIFDHFMNRIHWLRSLAINSCCMVGEWMVCVVGVGMCVMCEFG